MLSSVSANNHSDHVSRHAVVGSDNAVWTARINANGLRLFGCKTFIAPSRFVLLFLCRPATIFRAVSTVVFDAFYSPVIFWASRSWSHIFKKTSKAIWPRPSLTNGNAASSVVLVANAIRIRASSVHRVPNEAFWFLGHIVSPIDGWSSGGLTRQGQSVALL